MCDELAVSIFRYLLPISLFDLSFILIQYLILSQQSLLQQAQPISSIKFQSTTLLLAY